MSDSLPGLQPQEMLIQPEELLAGTSSVIFDCRFSLADAGQGLADYLQGHVPGAHYLHLERDLSGPPGVHGGRHPLPDPLAFAANLARFGVDRQTQVIAYDDSRGAFAARLWWLMRALGYSPPRLLNGGYRGFLAGGGATETAVPESAPCSVPPVDRYTGYCDIEQLAAAQTAGTVLIDSREPARYAGLEEPIDPVAGHIPGALNRPWQGVTREDGTVLAAEGLRQHWGDALDAPRLVVYCGSGVTACVNLFSLAMLDRSDALLYPGSWSDWCSYL